MEYLITGAGGFIGGYLSEYLSRKGDSVTAISRRYSPELEISIGEDHIFYKDIFDMEISELKTNAKTCIHLASANDIVSRNFEKGIKSSVSGTKKMLDYCVANGVLNFIFFSTFQVYGTELTGLITETTPVKPENDYGINHLFAEQYVEMYSRKYGMNCTVVRPTNIYGKPFSNDVNRWTLVPLCFCKEAFDLHRITLKSSGKQMRNFISLETVAKSCEAISMSEKSGFNIVNLASTMNLSIYTVAEMVKVVYEERYENKLEILIDSQSPAQSNLFGVELDKLNSYAFFPSDDQNMILNEIHGIFDLLEEK